MHLRLITKLKSEPKILHRFKRKRSRIFQYLEFAEFLKPLENLAHRRREHLQREREKERTMSAYTHCRNLTDIFRPENYKTDKENLRAAFHLLFHHTNTNLNLLLHNFHSLRIQNLTAASERSVVAIYSSEACGGLCGAGNSEERRLGRVELSREKYGRD